MESGLEGRNNKSPLGSSPECSSLSLNGVRPRRPEQLDAIICALGNKNVVSMESGLEGRNNRSGHPERALCYVSQWSPA